MTDERKKRSLPWHPSVKVVAHDNAGLIAIDKPAGLLSHPNQTGAADPNAIALAPYEPHEQAFQLQSAADGEPARLYLLNRLDSATSGLLLLAVSDEVRDAVLVAFADRQVRKIYTALVFGAPIRRSAHWRDAIGKEKFSGSVRATVGKKGSQIRHAETKLLNCRRIPGPPLLSELTLMPVTGRTHQLRIQAAKRGLPIVGDRTYGDFPRNRAIARSKGIRRLCLHCCEISLDYAYRGRSRSFTAKSACPFV